MKTIILPNQSYMELIERNFELFNKKIVRMMGKTIKTHKKWNPIFVTAKNIYDPYIMTPDFSYNLYAMAPKFYQWPDSRGAVKSIKIIQKTLNEYVKSLTFEMPNKHEEILNRKYDKFYTKEAYKGGELITLFSFTTMTYKRLYYISDSKEFCKHIKFVPDSIHPGGISDRQDRIKYLMDFSKLRETSEYETKFFSFIKPSPIDYFVDDNIKEIVKYFDFTKAPDTTADIIKFTNKSI